MTTRSDIEARSQAYRQAICEVASGTRDGSAELSSTASRLRLALEEAVEACERRSVRPSQIEEWRAVLAATAEAER